jgi:hypothetical protein
MNGSEPVDLGRRAEAIAVGVFGVWASIGQRWYDRAEAQTEFSPEDVVGDHTDLFEHLTPFLEQQIDLVLDLMRPLTTIYGSRDE